MNDPASEHSSPSPASGGPVNRRINASLIAAGLLALAYVGAIHYLDSRNREVFAGACARENSYTFRFRNPRQKKEKFWILNLRPGRITFQTDQDTESLNLVTTEESVIPAVKVSERLFSKEIKNNLVIRSVALVPRDPSVEKVNVRISRKPVLSLLFVAYQFAFLFVLISLGFLTILSFYGLTVERQAPQGPPFSWLVPALLLTVAGIFAFFVLNYGNDAQFNQLQQS